MADPEKYNRGYSFNDFQGGNPSKPLPGISLDNELENVELAVNGTIDALKDIRRSDGALKNGIVTKDALGTDIQFGVKNASLWQPDTDYLEYDTVFLGEAAEPGLFRAKSKHISGADFSVDLDAGLWEVMFDLSDVGFGDAAGKDVGVSFNTVAAGDDARFGGYTVSELELRSVPLSVNSLDVVGQTAAGDGLGGQYIDIDNGSADTFTSNGGTRRWYRAADVSLDRLNPNVRAQVETPAFRNVYRKKIIRRLPMRFADFDLVLAAVDATTLYPQAHALDEQTNQYFVLYEPSGGTERRAWIVVYDWLTGAHLRTFAAGDRCEGLVVKWEGANRFLVTNDGDTDVGKFDITVLPAARTEVASADVYSAGMATQISYRNGEYLISRAGAPIGSVSRRYVFGRFDEAFNYLGSVVMDPLDVGFGALTDSNYANLIPKHQGTALGDGYIVASLGGSWREGSPVEGFRSPGIRVYDMQGRKIVDGVIRPDRFVEIANAAGENFYRIENEGVIITSDSKVYSLFVTLGPDDTDYGDPEAEGLVIFEEFSADPDAIDFSDGAATYHTYNRLSHSIGVFPRSNNEPRNPVTGELFGSLNDVLAFMENSEHPVFSFFSTAFGINDLSGTPIPAGILVRITNCSNFTYLMEWVADTTGSKNFIIFGDPGARTQRQLRDNLYATALRLGHTEADVTPKFGRVSSRHYTNTEEDVLGLDINSASTTTTVAVGGGSSVFNAATAVRFYTAANTTTVAGTLRWSVVSDGRLIPGGDGTLDVGSASARLKEVWASVGAINTSDARHKTEVMPLSPQEIAAATDLAREVGTYQFLASVSEKGDAARHHVGMTVQRAIEIMESHGLDPMRYGFICYDEWDARDAETAEIKHEDGTNETVEVSPAIEAGSLYSFRHDQLALFIARGQAARLDALEQMLA